jgi:adhesin transport system outer membrane protein
MNFSSPVHRSLGQKTWRSVSLAMGLLAASQVHAVNLRELLIASVSTHPSVRALNLQTEAAGDSVEATQRQYWPNLSVQADSLSVASGGARLLRLEQTLWNGGLTGANVKGAEINLAISQAKVAMQQQKMALQVGAVWQALWSAQGRLAVAQDSLKQLSRFESMMSRRVQAELSVPVELELVRARMLQSKVDASRAQTDIKSSIERLEQLTRMTNLRTSLGPLPVGQAAPAFDPPIARLQSALTTQMDAIIARQPEVRLALDETTYALQLVEIRKAQAMPQAYARLEQSLSRRRDNSVYVGLNYSTGAGFSTFLETQALAKKALAAEQGVETAQLEARQSLVLDLSELQNARNRLDALTESVQGASTVLDSYERQFVANRKSWQDLMAAVRELSQSEAARVEAETQLVGALIRIQLKVDPNDIHPVVETRSTKGAVKSTTDGTKTE